MATRKRQAKKTEPQAQVPQQAIQPPQAQKQPTLPGHWSQISDGLRWLNDRALPVTGLMLAIAMCYLLAFIQVEKVPISITSAATALPSLFVMLVVLITLLTSFLLTPTLVLFTPLQPQGKIRLIDLLEWRDDGKVNTRAALSIVGAWFLKLAVIGGAFGLIIFFYDVWVKPNPLVMLPLGLLILALAAGLFLKVVVPRRLLALKWRESSWSLQGALVLGMGPQLLLMGFVLILAGRATESIDSVWIFALCILAGVIVLSLMQLAGAFIIAMLVKPDRSLAGAAMASIGLVALLGFYQPSAAWLTKTALQMTASGARACTVLSWTDEGAKHFESLRDPSTSTRTKPLRILMESDGQYLVRDRDTSSMRVDFIPRSIATGMDECPSRQAPPKAVANPT